MRGSVEKYGPTWRIRWDDGYGPNGRRTQRSKGGFLTKREAESALASALERARTGAPSGRSRLTVGAYLDEWLAGKRNLRPSTVRSYRGHIDVYLRPLLGHIRLEELRAEHIDRMHRDIQLGTLRRAPSATTTRRIHATLHNALQGAVRRRLISFNPAAQVELPSPSRRDRTVWSVEELRDFLRQTADHPLGPAIHVLALTGLRRGELLGLRWKDVDLDRAAIVVRQQVVQSGRDVHIGPPKTRRGERVVPIDVTTVSALRTQRSTQAADRLAYGPAYVDSDLVFAADDGAVLTPEALSRGFRQLVDASGLPRIVLHGLRHTHATHALAAGVDLTVVSRRLGHSTIALTADTYTRVLADVAREAADRVGALIAGQPAG